MGVEHQTTIQPDLTTAKQSHVVLNHEADDHGVMTTKSLSIMKARHLVSALRTSRHHGGGWVAHSDRDLDRATEEIHVLAQASTPRRIS